MTKIDKRVNYREQELKCCLNCVHAGGYDYHPECNLIELINPLEAEWHDSTGFLGICDEYKKEESGLRE